jgi:predicted ATPase
MEQSQYERDRRERTRVSAWMSRLIRERLARMSDADRLILSYAAVLGYRFDPEVLAAAMKRDLETLIAPLQRARDHDLIVEELGIDAACRFRHAIIRQALLDGLAREVTQRLHRSVVAALEVVAHGDRHIDALAYHALRADVPAKVLLYSERAGDRAFAVGARHEAARYFSEALGAAHDDASKARLGAKLRAATETN